MNGIEIETSEGWRDASAHVVSLGGGRFRASVRMRASAPLTPLTEANVRFEGRAIRGVVKTTIREPRSRLDTVVIEFRTRSA